MQHTNNIVLTNNSTNDQIINYTSPYTLRLYVVGCSSISMNHDGRVGMFSLIRTLSDIVATWIVVACDEGPTIVALNPSTPKT